MASRAERLLNHVSLILCLMFAVFLILDQFNPMMNFVDNAISRWLLGILCLSGAVRACLSWRAGAEPFRKSETA